MSTRTAQMIAGSLVVIYFILAAPGLYYQWVTGEILYGGERIPLYMFVAAGLLSFVWAVVGALILWNYPGNIIGWIMCLFPIGFALDHISFSFYRISLETGSGSLAAINAALIWLNLTDYPVTLFLFCLLFLLFPTGRPLSPRWRRGAWAGLLAHLGYIVLEALKPGPIFPEGYVQLQDNPIGIRAQAWMVLQPLHTIFLILSVIFLISTVISLVQRLRQSRGEERLQIKWFAYFAAIFTITVVAALIADLTVYTGFWFYVFLTLVIVSITGLAIAVAIAIFRYRLYAIDIIIRRTLIYGALTGLLAAIYFASVLLMQNLLLAISSQQLEIGSTRVIWVFSTLAIAALFNPLRRRTQDLIDRRFYRTKYDAEQALGVFGLSVRDGVDLESLTEALLSAVENTLQPKVVSLWLKEGYEPQIGTGSRK